MRRTTALVGTAAGAATGAGLWLSRARADAAAVRAAPPPSEPCASSDIGTAAIPVMQQSMDYKRT